MRAQTVRLRGVCLSAHLLPGPSAPSELCAGTQRVQQKAEPRLKPRVQRRQRVGGGAAIKRLSGAFGDYCKHCRSHSRRFPLSVRAPAQSSSQLCTHRWEPTWDSSQGGTLFSPSLDSIKVLLKNSLSSEIRFYFIMITQIPQHIKLTTIYFL